MTLFECSRCHVVENTACCNFWWDVQHAGNAALCSQCDPAIKEWHGHFPRVTYQEYVSKYGSKAVQFPLSGEVVA